MCVCGGGGGGAWPPTGYRCLKKRGDERPLNPFLLKLYFSYPHTSEKVPFHIVVLFKHRYQVGLQAPSGLSSRLFISVRPSKHLESRAVYGLGILMYVTNGYVVQIRLRLRHPIFIRVCVCIHTRSCISV